MGKRELLLIAGFFVVGLIAYRVTAPADASGGGFSLGRFIENIRSHVRGQNYQLEATRTISVEAPKSISTLRIDGLRGSVTVTGEDRPDVSVELKATVFGADEAQAKQFEKAITLTAEPDGETLDLRARAQAEEMHRRPHMELIVKTPKRLALRLALNGGELEVTNVRGVTFDRGSGKAVLTNVAGPVTGEFSSGTLEIENAGSIELETRRCDVRLVNIAGGVKIDANSGELHIRNVHGPTELSLQRIDAEIEDAEGPVGIEARGGEVRVRNAKGAVTARVERVELMLTLSTAVPVDATTLGDTLEVTLPPGGVSLQALSTGGQIRASDEGITVKTADNEQRASATLRGGGPLIKLEATRGDIVIR